MTKFGMEAVETDNRDAELTELVLPNGDVFEVTKANLLELLKNMRDNAVTDTSPSEDSAFRFTYKLMYTYCVQTTAPLLPGQLVDEVPNDLAYEVEEMLMNETGGRANVYLANISGEETPNADWSLF
jgi:hypothetical protein